MLVNHCQGSAACRCLHGIKEPYKSKNYDVEDILNFIDHLHGSWQKFTSFGRQKQYGVGLSMALASWEADNHVLYLV